jgi:hypothetical protein
MWSDSSSTRNNNAKHETNLQEKINNYPTFEILDIPKEYDAKLLVSSWLLKWMIQGFEKAHFEICRFCVGLVGRAHYGPRIPHP